jgi:hypothetical protein
MAFWPPEPAPEAITSGETPRMKAKEVMRIGRSRCENGRRAEQHHRNRDRRNERSAHVLQEEQHHEEHEADGLGECQHHVFDRMPYERRRVERIDHLEPGRECGFEPGEDGLDS